jgi:hypothetical protein
MVSPRSVGTRRERPGSSNSATAGDAPAKARKLWMQLASGLALTSLACFFLAWLAWVPSQAQFRNQLASALLQLAVVGIVGGTIAGFVKLAFEQYDDDRAAEARELAELQEARKADRSKRLDFLARMRAVHNAVAYAQWLMKANRSRVAYEEQIRELVHTVNQLWEIDADLEIASTLFSPADESIRRGVRDIITFLGKLTDEYEELVAQAHDNDTFMYTKGVHLTEFLAKPTPPAERLPWEYEEALQASKGEMRRLIYSAPESVQRHVNLAEPSLAPQER